MKNADKPINPIKGADDLFYNEQGESYIKQFKPLLGLTKREFFSVLAMQGLLALPDKGTYNSFDEAIERICELSIKFADELLKQLEKNK